MKKLLRCIFIAATLTVALAFQPVIAQTIPKTLLVYDAPPGTSYTKLSMAYGIMMKNLLGHFDATVEMLPVESYTAGKIEGYNATFYLGGYYNNTLPPAFLADVYATQKTVVWFKYNLWQLAWDPAYGFASKFGFNFSALRGMNAIPTASNPAPGFFDTITYKNKPFVKYYTFNSAAGTINADPEYGVTAVTDATKATVIVSASNPKTGETAPYVMRSGNFWYVADLPFSYIGPRDRYLVLTDLLHDMLAIPHAESHKAMVRLEDVGALVTVASMKSLTDYLYLKRIPFSIAVIPRFVDALGVYNGGIPQTIPMSQASNLKRVINYALPRGGEVVMHGYTHQYSNIKNSSSGISGDDYEFWNIVTNSPVTEDSTSWTLGRLNAGLLELISNGYRPVAWETPHYQASAVSSKAFPLLFNKTYHRVVYYTADQPNFNANVNRDFAVGQVFPYVIKKDHYGQMVLPESLGNIEYASSDSNVVYTWQDILTNAQYALTVRDGYASFFFHPFLLEPEFGQPGFADFKRLVEGITALGYTWTVPSKILP